MLLYYHCWYETDLSKTFIPTILVSSLVPTISAILTTIANKLNDLENYASREDYDTSLTRKIFVINFIISYLPVFLTAFVYVPFAGQIVPYLDVFHLTGKHVPASKDGEATVAAPRTFRIDPTRLRNQVIYFTVTAQLVGFAMETIVPFFKQKLFQKYKAYTSKAAETKAAAQIVDDGTPEEAKFLTRVRTEAELDDYDVTDDLRQMVVQFGYLALFSPVWSLVPLSFLVNNWIELRSDFFKICNECKRPTPVRTDSIGPWIDSLGLLSWLGSITSAALVFLFSDDYASENTVSTTKGWALLLVIFFSEHLYLLVRYAASAVIGSFDLPNIHKDRTDRYLMRKRYFDSTLKEDALKELKEEAEEGVKPRISLKEEKSSSAEEDPAEKFWDRQKSWSEAASIGAGIIEAYATSENVKKQQ